MIGFSEAVLFAVVLSVNLFLLGAVLAGGLTLAFRFLENVAPRLRYLIAVAVFLLAVLLPVAATLKISFKPKTLPNATREKIAQTDAYRDFAKQNNASIKQDVAVALTEAIEANPNGFFDTFVSSAAESALGKLFVGVWITGICLLILREVIGIGRIQNARRLWHPATEAERTSLLYENKTRLYFAENQSPGTIGLLRPVIVLPEQFLQVLTLESKRLIVRHELSHARWRDPLASLLLRIIRAVFWISPALWLFERLIDTEREAAADRAAILSMHHHDELKTIALDYAETLLLAAKEFNSFESRGRTRKLPLIGIGGAGTSELEIRIRRLLSSAQTTRLHVSSAIVAVLLTSVTASVMPLAAFSNKLRIRQNQTGAGFAPPNSLSSKEYISRILAADQQDKSSQKSVSGNEYSFNQLIPVVTDFPKTGKIRKTSIGEFTDSSAAQQISEETQDTSESFTGNATRVEDMRVSDETINNEDARSRSDQSNRKQPPAILRREGETVTITGNSGDTPAYTVGFTRDSAALNKLRTDLESEDELVRQKAASELDRLANLEGAFISTQAKPIRY